MHKEFSSYVCVAYSYVDLKSAFNTVEKSALYL